MTTKSLDSEISSLITLSKAPNQSIGSKIIGFEQLDCKTSKWNKCFVRENSNRICWMMFSIYFEVVLHLYGVQNCHFLVLIFGFQILDTRFFNTRVSSILDTRNYPDNKPGRVLVLATLIAGCYSLLQAPYGFEFSCIQRKQQCKTVAIWSREALRAARNIWQWESRQHSYHTYRANMLWSTFVVTFAHILALSPAIDFIRISSFHYWPCKQCFVKYRFSGLLFCIGSALIVFRN